MVWVKGHKGIKGNEEADKLCREASILGHESEGVVTPAGLRAWSKRGLWYKTGCARPYLHTDLAPWHLYRWKTSCCVKKERNRIRSREGNAWER